MKLTMTERQLRISAGMRRHWVQRRSLGPEREIEWPAGRHTAPLVCVRCGLSKPCQYLEDPLDAIHGLDGGRAWWCRPCYLDRKYEEGA